MSEYQKPMAEMIGTFWLVLGGCGTVLLAGGSVGALGIALAFGLSLLAMCYAIGHISGCHLNPAVTIGMWMAKKIPTSDLLPYIVAQVVGGVLAIALISYIVQGGSVDLGSYAANGFGEHSPGGFNMHSAFITEAIMTFMFVMVILKSTSGGSSHAGLAIGLTLVVIHLVSMSVTGTSVNPARSTASAIFAGGWAMDQLWLFWAAPVVGGAVAGVVFKKFCCTGGTCGTSKCS
ncbi:MAG TPA: aquaporin Z [Alphaproteobacteria bacterium]|nr:aquaporin Z [Rhodospirillaceae bacterium]HRJ12207.1 aquaporin Z [Alphaproteobacteria bacterium]